MDRILITKCYKLQENEEKGALDIEYIELIKKHCKQQIGHSKNNLNVIY